MSLHELKTAVPDFASAVAVQAAAVGAQAATNAAEMGDLPIDMALVTQSVSLIGTIILSLTGLIRLFRDIFRKKDTPANPQA